jgi:hypothetical protein
MFTQVQSTNYLAKRVTGLPLYCFTTRGRLVTPNIQARGIWSVLRQCPKMYTVYLMQELAEICITSRVQKV